MKRPAAIVVIILAFASAAALAGFIASHPAARAPVAPGRAVAKPPETEGSGEQGEEDYELPIPPAVPVTPEETKANPASTDALGGYDVLIADRGNNRIIEVTPDKRIVWEYDFDLPRPGLGADDAFFTADGSRIVAGLEEWQTIRIIDYATKQVVWEYGEPGKPGSSEGMLHTPDDPYMLPNGDVIVADIANCRIIEIAPDKKIVRQYGVTGKCGSAPGLLNKPNGDTPLPNGHVLVSNIRGHSLLELDEEWRPVFSMTLPIRYPSDPHPGADGTFIVAGYTDPGKIIEVGRDGTVAWELSEKEGPLLLRHPSLAFELPNGKIIANDDENHRVIVIDKATKRIVWQYGVSGKPGRADGQLNIPDGVDIIMRPPGFAGSGEVPRTVGDVVRHAEQYLTGATVIRGYPLKDMGTYVVFSDERSGGLTPRDLPVTGVGIAGLKTGQAYVLSGHLVDGGLKAVNGNRYHFELTAPPVAAE